MPSRLKQVTSSTLTRKRKVAQNLPHDGRHKVPKCATETKTVTANQAVKVFSAEKLTVSSNKLFCSDCREELVSQDEHNGPVAHKAKYARNVDENDN